MMKSEWEEAAWSVAESYLRDQHWDDKADHQCIGADCHLCNSSHEARREELTRELFPETDASRDEVYMPATCCIHGESGRCELCAIGE